MQATDSQITDLLLKQRSIREIARELHCANRRIISIRKHLIETQQLRVTQKQIRIHTNTNTHDNHNSKRGLLVGSSDSISVSNADIRLFEGYIDTEFSTLLSSVAHNNARLRIRITNVKKIFQQLFLRLFQVNKNDFS